MSISTTGFNILEFNRVDSTNIRAKELIRAGYIPEGTIIFAKEQFAGRGYDTNRWESEPGSNITMSCILRPTFLAPQKQFFLTKIISLALYKTVSSILPQRSKVSIKWPNDVYYEAKKIAGILVENNIMANAIRESVCGIGLNVNQRKFISDAPNPVSLRQLTGKTYNLSDILAMLLENIDYWYRHLQMEEFEKISESYHEALFRLGVAARYESMDQQFTGIITGTDPYGRLQIVTTSGEERLFDFKEVRFIL